LSFSQQEQETNPQLLVGTDGNSVVKSAAIPSSDLNNNNVVDNEGSAKEEAKNTGEFRAGNELEDEMGKYANVALQQSHSKQDKLNELETKVKEIETELESKSNENNQLQSQVEELKSKLKARPNVDQEDKSFEAEFQLRYDPLCDYLRPYYSKHIKSISFIATADFVTKSITNVQ